VLHRRNESLRLIFFMRFVVGRWEGVAEIEQRSSGKSRRHEQQDPLGACGSASYGMKGLDYTDVIEGA